MVDIHELAKPFANNPCGEDPRYSDNFFVVKQEIEKLDGIDYESVYEHCQQILLEEAKDLRVAGYLILAASYINGIEGLAETLELYLLLLQHEVHPLRPEARTAALKWLNNPRLASLVTEHALNQQQVDKLAALITELKKFTSFTILDNWLNKQQARLEQKTVQTIEAEIKTEIDVTDYSYQIIDHCLEHNDYLQAVAFARALRWSDMKLPPHENYETRIPAPRQEGLNKLQNALSAGNHEAVFKQCEALFLEPGGHVLLDLQYYAYKAAEGLAKDELVLFLQAEVAAFLYRIPGLIELRFADGTPFASRETLEWLESINIAGDEGGATVKSDSNVKEIIQRAKEEVKGRGLDKWLNFIKEHGAGNARDKFLHYQAMAQLCNEHKRGDLAGPILEQLIKQIQHHDLTNWRPDLVLAVWLELHQALKQQLKKASGATREQLMQKIDHAYYNICQLDAAVAMSI